MNENTLTPNDNHNHENNEKLDQSSKNDLFGDVVYRYTRAHAIADGVLIDISGTAQKAAITYPVAITAAVLAKYSEPPANPTAEPGIVWDIVWMLRCAVIGLVPCHIERRGICEIRYFDLYAIRRGKMEPEFVRLKALCGPGDEGEPVITILLPEED